MKRYLGLDRPYRFERAIPAFLASVLFVAVLGGSVVAAFYIRLPLFGPRGLYLIYLLILLALAVALVARPALSWSLILLAVVEMSWGIGSYLLFRANVLGSSLFPPAVSAPAVLRWHPLLQATLTPSVEVTSPGGLAFRHTSQGTRGREPGSLAGKSVVAVFGGSSTYDLGVGDGDTWVDRLGAVLGSSYAVINYGVPGYSTAEHVIQTAFYQDRHGKPRCAVYYVGWNDLRSAHIPDLDPGYADYHLPSQIDNQEVRRLAVVTFSPALTLLLRGAAYLADTVRPPADPAASRPPSAKDDPALDAIYARNITTISAINRGRGIPTIWVGQLVNPERLRGDDRYGWLPLVRDRDVWPMIQHLNQVLARTAKDLGDTYVGVSEQSFTNDDFVDNGHFSVRGAARFADALAPVVREACH